MYPSNAQKRVDSIADAFSHFNSKLLATGNNAKGQVFRLVPLFVADYQTAKVKAYYNLVNGHLSARPT